MIRFVEVKWDGTTPDPHGKGYKKASPDSSCPSCKCSVYDAHEPWGCLCRCHEGWKAMHDPRRLREEKGVSGSRPTKAVAVLKRHDG